MIRLDKYLAQMDYGSRSQVKELLKKGLVTVNGLPENRPELKVDEESDLVCVGGKECAYQRNRYYMLNKPSGCVSAVKDREMTVLDLLGKERREGLFPVGRLDKDTEGLLLITDDGELAHRLLSPKKHVEKTYLIGLDRALLPEEKQALRQGVDIGEKRLTLPARVEEGDGERLLCLTITEGRYHQVKRMIAAVGATVLSLKRVRMGSLVLDETLAPGQYRPLTREELRLL